MPPTTCNYCGVNVQNLPRHQRSNICLKKQKELGLDPCPYIYTCSCGFSSAIKNKLKVHQQKCKNSESVDEKNHDRICNSSGTTISGFEIVCNKNFQLTNETMINLFMKRMKDELQSNEFLELIYEDYLKLLDFIIVKCVMDKGDSIIIEMTDFSRKKIVIKNPSMKPEYDVGAYRIAGWIGEVLVRILVSTYNNVNNYSDIDDNIDDEHIGKKVGKIKSSMRILRDDFRAEYPILRKHIFNIYQKIGSIQPPSLSEIDNILEDETPNCFESINSSELHPQNLYIITSPLHEDANQFKVGIHTGNISDLISRYRTAIPQLTIKLFIELKGTKAKEIEDKVKETFPVSRIVGSGGNLSEFYKMPLNDLYGFIISLLSNKPN